MALKKRVYFSSTIKREYAEKLKELSQKTRIPQSKLMDEALEDLFRKYNLPLEENGDREEEK